MYSHGITFGGHPVMSAIALKNIEIMKRERIVERVREHEDAFRATLEQLLELPIVGDVRGTGFFYALELVKDKETRETFSDEECESAAARLPLAARSSRRGLICRADDRGDPVVQISPPLVAGPAEFDQIAGILGEVLPEAWDGARSASSSGRGKQPVDRDVRRASRDELGVPLLALSARPSTRTAPAASSSSATTAPERSRPWRGSCSTASPQGARRGRLAPG